MMEGIFRGASGERKLDTMVETARKEGVQMLLKDCRSEAEDPFCEYIERTKLAADVSAEGTFAFGSRFFSGSIGAEQRIGIVASGLGELTLWTVQRGEGSETIRQWKEASVDAADGTETRVAQKLGEMYLERGAKIGFSCHSLLPTALTADAYAASSTADGCGQNSLYSRHRIL